MTTTHAVPDTQLARDAAALIARTAAPFVVNHSTRTFHLGALLLANAGRSFDDELLYVASMLHDVALGTELDDGRTPFEILGAGIAAAELQRANRSDDDARLMFHAISRHMELSSSDDLRPEVAGVHLGAAADVIGLRLDDVPLEWLEVLIDVAPRLGMRTAFAALIANEAHRKPWSTASVLVHNFNFLDLIAAAPFTD